MITIKLKGGLGNQMFQYALGRKLSLSHQVPLALDIRNLYSDQRIYSLDKFCLSDIQIIKNVSYFQKKLGKLQKLFGRIEYQEPHFHFDNNIFSLNNAILDGYWQSEKYFMDIRNILLQDFQLKNPIQPTLQPHLHQIKEHLSVSVHIRRGDYISNPQANAFHGVINIDWYHQAINYINQRLDNPKFFFFSDDIEWVKHNFPNQDRFYYIPPSPSGYEHDDMYLMSCCQHQITANSSYSWWGAWLNQNPNKIVISPKQWFLDKNTDTKDVIPDSWIAL